MFNHPKLKEFREKAGLSQDDLIYKLRDAGLDIVRATWTKWENGITCPRVTELAIIASFFGVHPGVFFKS